MFSGDMRASSSQDNLIENMRKVSNADIGLQVYKSDGRTRSTYRRIATSGVATTTMQSYGS